MTLKVLTWNIRRANKHNLKVWEKIKDINADILLLQEVGSIPIYIQKNYNSVLENPIKKSGESQNFHTAILVKGKICSKIVLSSKYDWVNKELAIFSGNLVSFRVKVKNQYINLISVYSPAWCINKNKYTNNEIKGIKLNKNDDIWCTELLWDSLKNALPVSIHPWIISGDFNSSPTFDKTFSSGNQEIIDRMYSLDLHDCLQEYNKGLTPTFKNSKGGKVIHQLDYVYTTKDLFKKMIKSVTLDQNEIFNNSLSDHLPIITTFQL